MQFDVGVSDSPDARFSPATCRNLLCFDHEGVFAGGRMQRRKFITRLGGVAAAWSSPLGAQQTAMPVIGFLSSGFAAASVSVLAGFRRGLNETGSIDGQNVKIEYRWAEGQYDRLPGQAADLVGHEVAVIFAAGGSYPGRAAKAATATIPIVFLSSVDPVGAGLVASLNRPGGNVTGVSMIGSTLDAKRLELLHELVPKAATIAILSNPNFPEAKSQSQEVQQAAVHLGVKPIMLAASTERDIDTAFSTLIRQGAGALLIAQDAFLASRREQLGALAARHSLPTMYVSRVSTPDGGLVSYGADYADGYRQAGVYVGRILKGTKPGDLPVMQPTKFELVINLKTAKTLGLTIPPSILARADEVIE